MRKLKYFLMASIVMLVAAGSTLACSCAPSQSPTEGLSRASAVFAGRVLEVKREKRSADPFTSVQVLFEVYRVWKGVETRTVRVGTSSHSAACGYGFREGRTYLVYAY